LRLKKGEFKARKGDFGRVLNRIQCREALVEPLWDKSFLHQWRTVKDGRE